MVKKLCFLTDRSLGCDAQYCFSVSVLNCCLVFLPSRMSHGMCKGGCVCFHLGVGSFRAPHGKTKVLVSAIKGMEGALSFIFLLYFFND